MPLYVHIDESSVLRACAEFIGGCILTLVTIISAFYSTGITDEGDYRRSYYQTTQRPINRRQNKLKRLPDPLKFSDILLIKESSDTWDFIVEKAPWQEGFWERMVKCVKRYLKKAVGRASLSYEEMRIHYLD